MDGRWAGDGGLGIDVHKHMFLTCGIPAAPWTPPGPPSGLSANTRNHFVHCVVNELPSEFSEHVGLRVLEGGFHCGRWGASPTNGTSPQKLTRRVGGAFLANDPTRGQVAGQEAGQGGLSRGLSWGIAGNLGPDVQPSSPRMLENLANHSEMCFMIDVQPTDEESYDVVRADSRAGRV